MGVTIRVCDAILYESDRCRMTPRTIFSIWGVARWFLEMGKMGRNRVC